MRFASNPGERVPLSTLQLLGETAPVDVLKSPENTQTPKCRGCSKQKLQARAAKVKKHVVDIACPVTAVTDSPALKDMELNGKDLH